MITYSLRRSISLAYAGLLVTTAFISVTRADDSEGVVRVRSATGGVVSRGQSPQIQAPVLQPVMVPTRPTQSVIPPVQPGVLPPNQLASQLFQYQAPVTQPVSNEVTPAPEATANGSPSGGCTSTGCVPSNSCCPTGSCDSNGACGSGRACGSEVCYEDCDPVIGRRFGRRCHGSYGGRYGSGRMAARLNGGRFGGAYGDGYCPDGSCGRRGCNGGGTLIERELAKTCAWARLKFGYFIPTGSCGYGTPPFGHYSMVYPVNPQHFDARDGQVYAAQGYAGPVSVPLAPVVNHTYNYGWGIPSSRLTPVSHPVSPSQADAYRANQYAAPQGLR